MTTYYLVRHGEAHWDIANKKKLVGWGNDFVPLTEKGILQVETTSELISKIKPQIIVSSPMTRALQSAAIISSHLHLPLRVEFDLHEWIPDTKFQWNSPNLVFESFSDQLKNGGEWPEGEMKNWEPMSSIRYRFSKVLKKYQNLQKVVVVCHAVAIEALIGKVPQLAEVHKFQLKDLGGLKIAPMLYNNFA